MNFQQFGGGGPSDATQFSDTLISPDQPFIWGNLYHCCAYSTGGTTGNADLLAARVNRGASGLVFSGGGGGSTIVNSCAIPRPLSYLQVDGHNQFAQWTFQSDSSSGTSCNAVGIGVYTQTNQSLMYTLRKNATGTTGGVQLEKIIGGTDTLLGSVHTVNPGDILRIEVRTAGGVNTLKCIINGVILDTVTDSGITAGGMPCMEAAALFVGSQTTVFSNFSCGLLTS